MVYSFSLFVDIDSFVRRFFMLVYLLHPLSKVLLT